MASAKTPARSAEKTELFYREDDHRLAFLLLSSSWYPHLSSSTISEGFRRPTSLPCEYDWSMSTEENYRSNEGSSSISLSSAGKFNDIRRRLDMNYHSSYTHSRQILQDSIIESMLLLGTSISERQKPSRSVEPWIIFTAGVMGAGKTHTMEYMHRQGRFPLESFVTVDQDEIRRRLPEFDVYVRHNPETAGEHTRKEAGVMAEILSLAALDRGQHVLVDGSLRDARWYQTYFRSLRQSFPHIKLGIIHVTAPIDTIFERVEQRAKSTGRLVPEDILRTSIEQVPKSVDILKRQVDFFLEIHNSPNQDEPKIVSKGFQTTTLLGITRHHPPRLLRNENLLQQLI